MLENGPKISRTMKSPLVERKWMALIENALGLLSKFPTVLANQLKLS
jgi:hypothetical protein